MDKLGSIAKGGWHPEKTGSVRGDLKAMVGRGDNGFAQARERAESHQSTPITALKDPSTFGPPPKHTAYYGEESAPSPTTATASTSRPVPVPPKPENSATASHRAAESDEAAPPPGPFRIDTTGLSTANLPKPPVRRTGSPPTGSTTQPPVSRAATMPISSTPASGIMKPKKPGPPLPPRLPPRSNVAVATSSIPTSPPPSYDQATASQVSPKKATNTDTTSGLPNQGAIKRLSAAGVSVPGFNIGSQGTGTNQSSVPMDNATSANVSELQARFASLGSAVNAHAAENGQSTVSSVGKKPVPPPKKNVLTALNDVAGVLESSEQKKPPPVPLGTKPR